MSHLQNIVEEFEASPEGEEIGDMPLAVSLNNLLQGNNKIKTCPILSNRFITKCTKLGD